jgi:hypothetical protein
MSQPLSGSDIKISEMYIGLQIPIFPIHLHKYDTVDQKKFVTTVECGKLVLCHCTTSLPCSGSSRSDAGRSKETCDNSDRGVPVRSLSLYSLALLLTLLRDLRRFLLPFLFVFNLAFLFGVFSFFFGLSSVFSGSGKGGMLRLDIDDRLDGGL